MKKNLHKEQPPFVGTAKKSSSDKQSLKKAEARRARRPLLDVLALPSYQQLADLVAELTVRNVANLDSPDSRFVSCFTYGTTMPDHWQKAIDLREALIVNRVVARQKVKDLR